VSQVPGGLCHYKHGVRAGGRECAWAGGAEGEFEATRAGVVGELHGAELRGDDEGHRRGGDQADE